MVLSVRFEVGVSLLLAPARAGKTGPKAPFPLVENVFAREYLLERGQELGLTEITDVYFMFCPSLLQHCKPSSSNTKLLPIPISTAT